MSLFHNISGNAHQLSQVQGACAPPPGGTLEVNRITGSLHASRPIRGRVFRLLHRLLYSADKAAVGAAIDRALGKLEQDFSKQSVDWRASHTILHDNLESAHKNGCQTRRIQRVLKRHFLVGLPPLQQQPQQVGAPSAATSAGVRTARPRRASLKRRTLTARPNRAKGQPVLVTYSHGGNTYTTFGLARQVGKGASTRRRKYEVSLPGNSLGGQVERPEKLTVAKSALTFLDEGQITPMFSNWDEVQHDIGHFVEVLEQHDLPGAESDLASIHQQMAFLDQQFADTADVKSADLVVAMQTLIESVANIRRLAESSDVKIHYHHPAAATPGEIEELPINQVIDFIGGPLEGKLRNQLNRGAEELQAAILLTAAIKSGAPLSLASVGAPPAAAPAAGRAPQTALTNAEIEFPGMIPGLHDSNPDIEGALTVMRDFKPQSLISQKLWKIASSAGNTEMVLGRGRAIGQSYVYLSPEAVEERSRNALEVVDTIDEQLRQLPDDELHAQVREDLTILRARYEYVGVTLPTLATQTVSYQGGAAYAVTEDQYDAVKLTGVDHHALKAHLDELNHRLREGNQSVATFLRSMALVTLRGGQGHHREMNAALEKIRTYLCEHDPRLRPRLEHGQFGVAHYVTNFAMQEVLGIQTVGMFRDSVGGAIGDEYHGVNAVESHHTGSGHYVCRLATNDNEFYELDTVGQRKTRHGRRLAHGYTVSPGLWRDAPKLRAQDLCLARQSMNNCYLSAGWLSFCVMMNYNDVYQRAEDKEQYHQL